MDGTGEQYPESGPEDQKIICSPSYMDFRSRANTIRGLDFDHMMR
jgi:hypothetical protein